MSKQNLARWNRLLGWAFVVIMFFAVITALPRGNPILDIGRGPLYQTLNFALVPLVTLVHFGLSLYLFGFPRFSNGAKAWHVYIGYITFLVIFGSQSLIGPDGPIEPWFTIGNIIMYVLIVVHVVLGFQHWSARRSGKGDAMASVQRGAKSGT